jgi:serine/threonine protein kinase/Tol biopolymer transport system component
VSVPSWADLEAIFHEALERAPADRAAFLAERCAGRPELRAEVEALLRAHANAASALEVPLVAPQTHLKTGVRVGPYEVVAELGAGGMGEVYRARDAKLGRDVALKILPLIFTSDPERLARFEREARMLAALSHPHIGAIYGFEESESIHALVLELIDGPTLADRLAKGPIPVTEALGIATQIADALEAAHELGIVHRDLKPANIKITAAGVVKVLDFGLAKALALDEAGATAGALSKSPTITVGGTRQGMILGTAAYMSPEQARGQAVDKRTDIWAFGCVLYELLTGCTAFPGETISDTIAAILGRGPDWQTLPGTTPANVRRLVQRCLEKDPKRRLHDIADARIEIDEALTAQPAETALGASSPIVRPTSQSRRIATFAAVALVAASLAGIAVWLATRPILPLPHVSRFTITPSSEAAITISGVDRDLAITPDGTRIVYVGANGSALFVRALDQLEATRLTGLGAPHGPFLSPDGQWIGFTDGTTALKKVALNGGPAVTLARIDGFGVYGATWGPDDTVVFATNNTATGLQQIPAAGGEPTVLRRPNRAGGEADHLWPEFLPDGEAVLFTITPTVGGLDAAAVAVLDLRTGAQTVLVRRGSHAHYVRSGHLVYAAGGTLLAVPFDLARRAVVGSPVPVVSPVVSTQYGAVDAAVAADGTLVYMPVGAAADERRLVWVDRQGREEPIASPPRAYVYPRLAPDGTRLALLIGAGDDDVWLWDLVRAALTRVTFEPGQDTFPVWTPDSRRLLFSSERAGARSLFGQAADGTGGTERLTESRNMQNLTAISPDGARLVFTENVPGTGEDVMTVPLSGERRATPLVQTPFVERNGEVSPDGRWLAYQANDSGQFEIYVRPFPDVTTGHWQVSTGGGTRPLWARNGQELFYLAPTGALMRVGVERGNSWAGTPPVKLLEGRYFAGAGGRAVGRTYDVSPDGRRFLMIKPGSGIDSAAAPASLVVVQNWVEELKRLVPTK